MNYGKILLTLAAASIMCLGIAGQLALADDEENNAKQTQPAPAEKQAALHADEPGKKEKSAKPLQGSVSSFKTNLGAQGAAGEAQIDEAPLQSHIDENWFDPSAILNKTRLTSEDFRNVEFGITGFVVSKHAFNGRIIDRFPVVTLVFPGCPAEKAGIQLGDKLIQANNHVFTINDMQPQLWRILDGPAGSKVTVTMVRNGEPRTFQLERMNIEDIPDPMLRREYERMIQTLGTPMQ